MISGESFVYFGPEPWDSMWRNRHHLLSRLAKCNRAVYVEPRPYVEQVTAGLRRGEMGASALAAGGLSPVMENLWVYRSPGYAALGGPPPLRAATHVLRRSHLRRSLATIGASQPIVWLSTPAQYDARYDLSARLRVYHIVDDYLGYHDMTDAQRVTWRTREQEMIAWADMVVVVSEALLATKGAGNSKFRLLPNAVDDRAYAAPFRGAPPALAALPRPVLGYVGLVSVRLDLAMLDDLAAAHPEWSLVLMGTVYRSGCADLLDRLSARPNVHFLPPVPGADVADYVRAFDVGLVPYRVTTETVHASPLKVYEYLAAGLPVVAAEVPGACQFAEVVAIARTPAEWQAAVARQLAANTPAAAEARRRAISPHTWDARVNMLSGYLADVLARKNQPIGP